jgi:hypothetical protein
MSFTTVNITTNPDEPKFLYNINSYGPPLLRPGGTPLQAGDIWNDLDYGIARTYTGVEWRSPGIWDSNTNFSVGNAALTPTSNTGFFFLPSVPTAPDNAGSNPPRPYVGAIPMVWCTGDNKIYVREATGNWLASPAFS